MKKECRLYNVLFPLWMIPLLAPITWLIILPGNFLIDSLVLCVAMAALKIEMKMQFYRKHILKIFGFGLLADLIGAGIMLLVTVFVLAPLDLIKMGDEWYLTVPGLLLSAVCIFIFNYFVTFRNLEQTKRKKLALIFAIFTAPYSFLVPSAWLYG